MLQKLTSCEWFRKHNNKVRNYSDHDLHVIFTNVRAHYNFIQTIHKSDHLLMHIANNLQHQFFHC